MLTVIAWQIVLLSLTAGDPPTDAQVLRAMSKPLLGGLTVRDNITIVKDRREPQLISIPLLGSTAINAVKESWSCTVYYDQVVPGLPFQVLRTEKMEVVQFHNLRFLN